MCADGREEGGEGGVMAEIRFCCVWSDYGKQVGCQVIRIDFSSPSKIVVYGHFLVTLPTQLMKH